MTSRTLCFLDAARKPTRLRPALPAVAIWAALIILLAAGDHAAAGRRNESAVEAVDSRVAGAPVMAIVSLHSQRITVYDASGWILRAPVSTGQQGRETPAGIFSVIGKEVEHYSNLYDDAYMPHMQRITWSGIALHGGPLPGYPASHGCIRMPYDFAERLFGETKLGMRVIVTPTDSAPVDIAHPKLFPSKPGAAAAARAAQAEAEEAASKAEQAKRTATAASRDAAQASMPVRAAESLKRKADTQLAAAERKLASAGSEVQQRAEDARAKAAAQVAEVDAQVTNARAELQSKLDAAASARQAAAEAETVRVAAAEAARKAARDLEPVSVFISRKTQRLYVRQAFQPILEIPVTIQDADLPIGTHVFTATERIGDTPEMRWSAVSLVSERVDATGGAPDGAKAALDRIVIPSETLDRIAGMASPRSSLIISDEALSDETSKGTDFIVLMSGEPQGGIKFRRHSAQSHDRLPYRYGPLSVRSPFFGPW